MCMEERGLTRKRFFLDIAALSVKTIRSIGFNVLMLILGFTMGFGTMHLITHIAWTRNPNYECIRDIEQRLKDQRILDDKIDREITELKLSIIHQEKKEGK